MNDKILYIEDNEDTAQAVKTILKHRKFEVDLALTGKEGLSKAVDGGYDLILIDIMLPDTSGWDVFQKLNKSDVDSNFAFLSAIPVSSERREELEKAGVSDYIVKPFDKNDLIKRIKKILE